MPILPNFLVVPIVIWSNDPQGQKVNSQDVWRNFLNSVTFDMKQKKSVWFWLLEMP